MFIFHTDTVCHLLGAAISFRFFVLFYTEQFSLYFFQALIFKDVQVCNLRISFPFRP